MRLWAALRSRLAETAREAVRQGNLEDPEQIWHLGTVGLRSPPAEWRARLASSRMGGLEPLPPLFWSDNLEAVGSTALEAVVLVAGVVTGQALVARTPQQALNQLKWLKTTPILVAPAVDPGWLPVFLKVGGVITELGGRLSHAAILLQELRIPAAFNVSGVSRQVRTGDEIRLEVPPGRLVSEHPSQIARTRPSN